jgi:hypothetical protein
MAHVLRPDDASAGVGRSALSGTPIAAFGFGVYLAQMFEVRDEAHRPWIISQTGFAT